jgi:secreted Zn-dependent insulinase-like peptidase
VIEKVLQQDKNLTQETNRHWTEICSSAYTFDRREQTAAVLKTLTLQQILAFMDDCIVPGAAQRRAFCSQVCTVNTITDSKEVPSIAAVVCVLVLLAVVVVVRV